ncbi:metallophosphoesterase family protein, partial [Thermodesulfobacteriota bacterium]
GVVRLLHERGIPSVLGNHEAAVLDPGLRDWFNPQARRALERTLELLSQETVKIISQFPRSMTVEGALCVHGFPPASFRVYLFQVPDRILARVLPRMKYPVCFVGHTHTLEMVCFDGEAARRDAIEAGRHSLGCRKHIVNVGSLGQPRDGDNNAKYVIWNTGDRTVEVRYVRYDIARTVRKITERGLPEIYALRLW